MGDGRADHQADVMAARTLRSTVNPADAHAPRWLSATAARPIAAGAGERQARREMGILFGTLEGPGDVPQELP
jgi:hypothetical protein